ncbi:hypothetical protein ACFXJ8_39130 [Nonomuraea sp. NPDC059194]|uniref:hypothetical protein n=1 Tax=Nonomuraea sp. NPDC059194 TaxID=3346764 RepID=UPI0036BC3DDF
MSAASASPACPVCGGPIEQARTGRPARYCGTPCRQAAHRARRRTAEAAAHAAWLRGRLAADLARARQLAAELATALADIPAGVDGGQADIEPPTGWESELGELAHRLATLATTVRTSARDHQAVTADWQHAARTAGIRHVPATTAADDETPAASQSTSDNTAASDGLAAELPGRAWDDTDVCLVRVDGQWHLYGPDGEINVDGFGLFGHIRAADQHGAQQAAADAVTALTGRQVTSWDRDAWSRSIYGESSWYACLAD